MTEHTPTPWISTYNKRMGHWSVHHAQRCERGDTSILFVIHTSLDPELDEANAKFVRDAVNEHETNRAEIARLRSLLRQCVYGANVVDLGCGEIIGLCLQNKAQL